MDSTQKTLDDIVLALQKSFSRVTEKTNTKRKDETDDTIAMIIGDINFEITLKVNPDNDKLSDRLIYDKEGAITIKLNGIIDPDIRDNIE